MYNNEMTHYAIAKSNPSHYCVVCDNDYLAHHGVKGQKWGVRHDPERVGRRSARKGLSKGAKIALGVGASVVGAAALGYGAHKTGLDARAAGEATKAVFRLTKNGLKTAAKMKEAKSESKSKIGKAIYKSANDALNRDKNRKIYGDKVIKPDKYDKIKNASKTIASGTKKASKNIVSGTKKASKKIFGKYGITEEAFSAYKGLFNQTANEMGTKNILAWPALSVNGKDMADIGKKTTTGVLTGLSGVATGALVGGVAKLGKDYVSDMYDDEAGRYMFQNPNKKD